MAKGKVIGTNVPENKGSIQIDGGTETYVYNVKAGDTVGGYVPQKGDDVNFTASNNNVARDVSKIEDTSPNCTLSANPAVVSKGQQSTLSYTTLNAVRADIQPQVGPVQVGSGTAIVTTDVDTKYVITVQDANGNTASSGVMIFVQ